MVLGSQGSWVNLETSFAASSRVEDRRMLVRFMVRCEL